MPRTPKKLKQGQIALVCDGCAELVRDDDGYLCVIEGHDGVRRWRVLHDSCTLDRASGSRTRIGSVAGSAMGSAIVRSGRVATYTELLSVLADLGRDGSTGFATTAWPNLLQRIAFDTNWELNGRKGMTDLGIENRSVLSSAGLGSKGGVIVEVPEVNAESIARQDRKERQRQRDENAGLVRVVIGERN